MCKILIGTTSLGDKVEAKFEDMHHILVAGQTGSGKSNWINNVLKAITDHSPTEFRLALIDPKMVELDAWKKKPHTLYSVTDTRDARTLLRKMIKTMNTRYEFFARAGVKNIKEYNEKFKDDKKPRVVIVIDEFANLILDDKGIETLVVQLAQKARASGIHLIIGTQYPVAKVITGLIKTNLPTIVCFSLQSSIHSRVAIGESGAEKIDKVGQCLVKLPQEMGYEIVNTEKYGE